MWEERRGGGRDRGQGGEAGERSRQATGRRGCGGACGAEAGVCAEGLLLELLIRWRAEGSGQGLEPEQCAVLRGRVPCLDGRAPLPRTVA